MIIAERPNIETHEDAWRPAHRSGVFWAGRRWGLIIFFWDPLEPHPHDVDVKAVLRVAVVHNVPIACNRATADFLLSSPVLRSGDERLIAKLKRGAEVPALLTT